MKQSRRAYGLGAIVVALLVGGVFSVSGLPQALAAAPSALDGRSFAVTVTNCQGQQFSDTYCFGDHTMAVEVLGCTSAPALTFGSVFASRVSNVLFVGTVQGNSIRGKARSGTCVSRFTGTEIPDCPCALTVEEQQESNPYQGSDRNRAK